MSEGNEPRVPAEMPVLWQLQEYFGAKVSAELNLIGQRMAWLVMSQSFLFLTWVSSVNLARPATLRSVIALVGLLVAVSAYLSIGAAMRVLDTMGGYYLEAVEKKLRLPLMGHNRNDEWTIRAGNAATLAIPPLFAGLWAGALFRSSQRIESLSREDYVAVAIAVATFIACILFSYNRMWRPKRFIHHEPNLTEPLDRALAEWERASRPRPPPTA